MKKKEKRVYLTLKTPKLTKLQYKFRHHLKDFKRERGLRILKQLKKAYLICVILR
jgi:hypothetical protein